MGGPRDRQGDSRWAPGRLIAIRPLFARSAHDRRGSQRGQASQPVAPQNMAHRRRGICIGWAIAGLLSRRAGNGRIRPSYRAACGAAVAAGPNLRVNATMREPRVRLRGPEAIRTACRRSCWTTSIGLDKFVRERNRFVEPGVLAGERRERVGALMTASTDAWSAATLGSRFRKTPRRLATCW
jgi:hypothetical protein